MLTGRHILYSTVALAMLSAGGAALAKKAPAPRGPHAAPTPAPTPTPTPVTAPAPTPTPALGPLAVDTTLDSLTQDHTFAAYQNTVKQEYAASGPNAGKPTSFGNYARVTASVRYDADTQSYIVRDTGNVSATSSFGPGNVVGAESNSTYTVYRKTGGGSTETLTLLNPGAGNPAIQLSYVSFGHWLKVTPGGGNFGNTARSDTYFVYGFKTARADMPTTGGASYETLFDGNYVTREKNYDIDGTGTLSADFLGGTLSFSSSLTGTPASGAPIAFGAINGSGSINSNAASFSATGNNGTFALNMAGYFYGPTANEVGAVFQLKGPRTGADAGSGNGAMVGGPSPP